MEWELDGGGAQGWRESFSTAHTLLFFLFGFFEGISWKNKFWEINYERRVLKKMNI